MPRIQLLLLVIASLLLASCKLTVTVPEGGVVVTESGAYTCSPGNPCEIDVVDLFFDETFIAKPADGYRFEQWNKRDRGMCGGSTTPCHLFTSEFEGNEALLEFLESDDEFYLEPVFVSTTASPPTLRQSQDGDVFEYRATVREIAPDGEETLKFLTGSGEFFATQSTAGGYTIMEERTSFLPIVSIGNPTVTSSFFWQDESGNRYNLADGNGNFTFQPDVGRYGVLNIPSPLMETAERVYRVQTLAGDDPNNPLSDGTYTLSVSGPQEMDFPLGRFEVYKVKAVIDFELVATPQQGARGVSTSILWVAPDVGSVKQELKVDAYDADGIFQGSVVTEVLVDSVNF